MELKDYVNLALSVVFGLLVAELVAWSPKISDHLRRVAVNMMPLHHRARADEEWRRAIEDNPGPLSKIVMASRFIVGAGAYPSSSIQMALIRFVDISVSLSIVVFVMPLLLFVGIFLLIERRGPILSLQARVGMENSTIYVVKFSVMYPDAQARLERFLAADEDARNKWISTGQLDRDPRFSKLGRFLYLSHMNELPQLFNVLRGDLSIVGPPAPRADQMSGIGLEQLRPGMADIDQVKWTEYQSSQSVTQYIRLIADVTRQLFRTKISDRV
ncbi:MAG: sugar transferase [Gallionella sp.]|nr:sugar transferase [Gallionella sp.]